MQTQLSEFLKVKGSNTTLTTNKIQEHKSGYKLH